MKKSEFEAKLLVGIEHHRLAILRELANRDLFYSSEMYDSSDIQKIYLLELHIDYFILRYDLIFDESVEKFFHVSKERYEYTDENLKDAIRALRQMENKVYEILSRLRLRGFYGKGDFIHRILKLVPQLEWVGHSVRDAKSGMTFMTVKDEELKLTYKDGKADSYMIITRKDFNEKVLNQCVELINAALKYNGL